MSTDTLAPPPWERIVADVVEEWWQRLGRRTRLELTGPAGGSFGDDAWSVRCAFHFDSYPDSRYADDGFRVVVSPFLSDR